MSLKGQITQIVKNKNFKHGMLYTIFSFINSGISFVLLLILVKFLTPFEYGQLNLFTTFVTLVNIIITLATNSYITVSFFQKDKETLTRIIVIVIGITTLMLMVCSSVLLFFPELIGKIIGVPTQYLWLGILICYFQVFNTLNLDIWRLEEKPISYGLYSVSFAICNFILTFWLVVGLDYGWSGRVYAWWILGSLYFLISVFFLIKRKYLLVTRPNMILIKETLIYALPLLPHTASFWFKQGLDRYIINYFYNQTDVGYYSFAMNMAAIIGIVGTAFNSTNSVYIYKNLAQGYTKVKTGLKKQTHIMTGVFVLVSVIIGIFAIGLIHFFLSRYTNSIKYVFPLCAGGLFQCIYLLWVNYLFFYKKTLQLMMITLSTAIIQVIFSFWLTRYSIMYTAYISMIISLLTAGAVYIYSKTIFYENTKNCNC